MSTVLCSGRRSVLSSSEIEYSAEVLQTVPCSDKILFISMSSQPDLSSMHQVWNHSRASEGTSLLADNIAGAAEYSSFFH